MTMLAARPVTRQAVRLYSRSALAPEPKMHKAVGNWEALVASKRYIDEDEHHKVFHPPFNKSTIMIILTGVVGIGWGSMWFGFRHQQYKQGFWK